MPGLSRYLTLNLPQRLYSLKKGARKVANTRRATIFILLWWRSGAEQYLVKSLAEASFMPGFARYLTFIESKGLDELK